MLYMQPKIKSSRLSSYNIVVMAWLVIIIPTAHNKNDARHYQSNGYNQQWLFEAILECICPYARRPFLDLSSIGRIGAQLQVFVFNTKTKLFNFNSILYLIFFFKLGDLPCFASLFLILYS